MITMWINFRILTIKAANLREKYSPPVWSSIFFRTSLPSAEWSLPTLIPPLVVRDASSCFTASSKHGPLQRVGGMISTWHDVKFIRSGLRRLLTQFIRRLWMLTCSWKQSLIPSWQLLCPQVDRWWMLLWDLTIKLFSLTWKPSFLWINVNIYHKLNVNKLKIQKSYSVLLLSSSMATTNASITSQNIKKKCD